MPVLANLYFDVVKISQGIAFLVFTIFVVLLCEYAAYRILFQKLSAFRVIFLSLYANFVSGLAGLLTAETIDDFIIKISYAVVDSNAGLFHDISLFITMFVLTCLIEFVAIFFLRKKLKLNRIVLAVTIANVVSYTAIAIMLGLYSLSDFS